MSTPRLPPITEKEFQAQIVKLAKIIGFEVYHTWNSRHSAKGFPDLVLVRPPQLLFLEVKTEKGKLTVEQARWIAALMACDQEVYLVRPSNWPQIEAILKGVES